MSHFDKWPEWTSQNSRISRELLKTAYNTNRPVIFLLGAGMSADSGIPMAGQLSQYLVQVWAMIKSLGFSSPRQYLEETGWPSRHDLRLELMLEYRTPHLNLALKDDERCVSQASLVSELRRSSPTLAFSLDEVFGQMRNQWNKDELAKEFGDLKQFASNLAKRVPRNVAYRSLLFYLCENSQALIDGCLDHFIRDRSPTTTHQFIVFFSKLFRSQVILSTNFDSLLERAFAVEGFLPRVYEIQGEGSLPSARMLLSQQYSVVKLHGGAHQMRTGFDLDDPLSPNVLASFYELFDMLQDRYQEPPLMLVMGYSGSDRRVMDIVGTVVKRWKTGEHPCVLWVQRDPWVPELLKSVVSTHPHVLYRQAHAIGTRKKAEETVPTNYPVHLVRYQEGRLFLLEHVQHIANDFPISQLNYQAVNFVPHALARKENIQAASELSDLDEKWTIAAVAASLGGGSSSQLAKLANDLDSRYRVIWIDLAEVPNVSALVDVLAERLAKYDHRLQVPKRPLLLQNALYGECPNIIDESGEFHNPELVKTESWEMEIVVRWIAHALRRGEYLILLDSLDEFPGTHPALAFDDDKTLQTQHDKEKSLLVKLLMELGKRASQLGDSRIALATTYISTGKQSGPNPPTQIDYLKLQEYIRREAGTNKMYFRFIHLPESPSAKITPQIIKTYAVAANTFAKQAPKGQKQAQYEQAFQLTLLVAACGRRIRSEQLLSKATGRLLQGFEKCKKWKSIITLNAPVASQSIDFLVEQLCDKRYDYSPRSDGGRPSHEVEQRIRSVIEWISGFYGTKIGLIDLKSKEIPRGKVPTTQRKKKDPQTRWFYRLEGGYHWMHREIRDNLYQEAAAHNPLLVALVHQRVAEFCIDDLYMRSIDTRALLEYLFHRLAYIRMLSRHLETAKPNNKNTDKLLHLCLEGILRVSRVLERYQDVLLARARIPALVSQIRLFLRVIATQVVSIVFKDKSYQSRLPTLKDATCRTLSVLANVLLSAGHMHTATQCQVIRLRLLATTNKVQLRTLFCHIHRPGWSDFSIGTLQKTIIPNLAERKSLDDTLIETISDLVNALTDSFSGTIKRLVEPDWCKSVWYVQDHKHPAISRQDRKSILGLGVVSKKSELRSWLCEFRDTTVNRVSLGVLVPAKQLDLARRIQKREQELTLNSVCPAVPNTIRLYLPEDYESETGDIDRFRGVFASHFLRTIPMSPRHECYRLCLWAKFELARLDLQSGWVTEAKDWAKIWGLFLDAEAVINRQGGPADLQALAITRILHAESLIQAAETLRCVLSKIAKQIIPNGKPANKATTPKSKIKSHPTEKIDCELSLLCQQYHQRAFQLLTSAEPLINEGRGENRWRVHYSITRARWHLLRANLTTKSLPVKAVDDFTWAGRYLAGAAGNVGRWTDRRYVLKTWWSAFETSLKNSFPSAEDSEYPNYVGAKLLRRMRSRLGIDWNLNWRNPLEDINTDKDSDAD